VLALDALDPAAFPELLLQAPRPTPKLRVTAARTPRAGERGIEFMELPVKRVFASRPPELTRVHVPRDRLFTKAAKYA
jgi:hypothetical protein